MASYQLHLGDCLEILPTLPDASVDAIIADPPYGTTACKWDSVIPLDDMWAELKRVIKPRGAVVLFGSQPFTTELISSNRAWFKYCWVWEKQQPTGFLHARQRPMKAHEDIVVFSSGQTTYNPQGTKPVCVQNGRKTKTGKGAYNQIKGAHYVQTVGDFPRTVLKIPCLTHNQIHPTQKPVALLEYLVRTYTNEGDTVLDFCFGSGTTGVACIKTGRNFIGCEKDASYYEIARQRLDAEAAKLAQMELV
jgi:site-specific DNA-methyltransferase (adenine-specific)